MPEISIPDVFRVLLFDMCIKELDIVKTSDGFFLVCKALSNILSEKNIFEITSSSGRKYECDRFFDDWFLYAIHDGEDCAYSLLKLREQENDAAEGLDADGDTPGVTISFIPFESEILLRCLENPSDENRKKLNDEINRVVSYRGQCHHKAIKRYFKNPRSKAAYLVADVYARRIASYAENGYIEVPECYKEIVKKSCSGKNSSGASRLTRFIEALNREAGRIICDNAKIYIKNPSEPTEHEAAAILTTHTGNTSLYSFAAEVEYHARFLMPLAKIRIPFLGRSVYDSAIRADMTVEDAALMRPAPYYRSQSRIVKRQYIIHKER